MKAGRPVPPPPAAAGASRAWRWGVLAAVLAVAGAVRFADLAQAAVRSDEIAFLTRAMQDLPLVELWKNPPWLNQIPFSETVTVVWARMTGQAVNEAVIRQPFALMGWLTVGFCTAWMLRRRGTGAGALLGFWLALLPYHVYHSREAYYYVQVMLFAAGMALRGADFAVALRGGRPLKAREYVEWTAWALLACLTHMSAWMVAGLTGLILVHAGWAGLPATDRRRHLQACGWVALAVALGLSRWIFRAYLEMQRVKGTSTGHIGGAFGLVGPRVLPVFAGGANAFGLGILAVVLAAAALVLWKSRGRPGREDPLYGAMSMLALAWVAGSFAYIFFAGGGETAKLAYFAANLPVFLAWAAMTLDRAFVRAPGRGPLVLDLAAAAVLAGILVLPTVQVMRLEGKPTAYRPIRAWLDANLTPGDVVIVDRWLEPWNEMGLYAPSNVTVSFTVPDDPYENYVHYNWRQTTRAVFERNGAQAFMRIARNQEKRLGLWTWPETWFRHRAVVTNTAGLWLRDTGFAPMEEYYSETNRVLTEIFYDTHEDIAERARAAGQDAVWFFGEGWRLFKPWQQGDFNDYRVLQGEGVLNVHNVRGEPIRVRGEVAAVAPGGPATVRIGEAAPLAFPAGQLASRTFEIDLPPGVSALRWKNLGPDSAVLVRDLRLVRVE